MIFVQIKQIVPFRVLVKYTISGTTMVRTRPINIAATAHVGSVKPLPWLWEVKLFTAPVLIPYSEMIKQETQRPCGSA